jgi:lipopolysaccharide/colanic/teichoic acid biosynthesis glycosyltransferase
MSSQSDPRVAWRDPPPIFHQPVGSGRQFAAARARHQARAAQLDKEPGRSSLKRLFDVMVAGAALLFFAPLSAAIAIAI